MGHIIKIGKHDKIRLRKKVRLKEILILKENHFSGYMKFVSSSIITKVFKGESVRRGVFVFVRRGVSLEALRRKLFKPHII